MFDLGDTLRAELDTREVGIEEFAMSPEFCNRRLYPRQLVLLKILFLEELDEWELEVLHEWQSGVDDVEISPNVLARMEHLRSEGYDHFGEYDAVAGRRASKNFIAGIAVAKIAYEVQKLGDPGAHYGIDPTKEIYFSGVAASQDQSKKGIYSDLVNTITTCKALQPHIGGVLEEAFRIKTTADRELVQGLRDAGIPVARDFSKLRVQALPANARTVRGITSMAIVFDEMAFMMEGESASTGAEVYAAAEPSIAQFGKDGLIICQSSPFTKDGQFHKQVAQAMAIDEHGKPESPHMLAFKYPSWALYKGWETDHARQLCLKWGHAPFDQSVMANPDIEDSEQPSDADRIKAQKERSLEKADPVKYKIERRAQWAEVLDAFLRPEVVEAAFAKQILVPKGNPDGTDFILDVTMNTQGTYQFVYCGHVDPSSTTAGFGFAMGHIADIPDTRFEGGMGRHVVFDLVRRWNPADFPGHTIDYLQVQDEVLDYIDWFRPREFTFDQFQSQAPMQYLRKEMLERKIYETKVFEVTATAKSNWSTWDTLRTAMNMGLVHVPPDCIIEGFDHSSWAKRELMRLQEKKTAGGTTRVEKSPTGEVTTKDVADCVAAVTFKFLGSLLEDFSGGQLSAGRLAAGSPGGYQMGGRQPEGPMSFGDFYQGKGGGPSPRTRGRGGNR